MVWFLFLFFQLQDTNSENKKDQQLAKAKAWEAEIKRKCKPMKPVTVGCLWFDEASLNLTLKQFAACLLVDAPVDVENPPAHLKNIEVPVDSPSTANNGGLYVPDEGNVSSAHIFNYLMSPIHFLHMQSYFHTLSCSLKRNDLLTAFWE